MNNSKSSKVNIKIGEMEISVTGTEDFINNQFTNLPNLLDLLHKYIAPVNNDLTKSVPSAKPEESDPKPLTVEDIVQQPFSVWKKALTTNDDLVSYALGGYYIQLRNKDNYFTTNKVFSLMYEHGILLTDVKQCEEHHLKSKNIIKVGTVKKENKYRISEYCQKLIHEIIDPAFL